MNEERLDRLNQSQYRNLKIAKQKKQESDRDRREAMWFLADYLRETYARY